jgi:DNA-binding winged helix-turn-helix (wHTH) protein/TolB-like protein
LLCEPEALQFGRFTLDRKHRRLLSAGKPLTVQDKVFDLLEYFVLHPGEALRRDDIIAHVWSGRTVSEGSLSVQLSALRKVLEKAGSTEPLILTLPNQRYRFVGEVSLPTIKDPPPEPPQFPPAPPLPPQEPARRQRWIAVALAAGTALAGLAFVLWRSPTPASTLPGLSLVVLPFENRSTDHTEDILAANITDDLTNDLSHLPATTVIARESAEAVRGKTPQQIGAALHVRYIIKGTVSPDDAGYHVAVHVIEAETGKLAPGDSFDEPRDRESALRDAIVHGIASRLHLELDALESSRSLHDRPDNPSATDLFFQARAMLDGADDAATLHQAQELLEAAIRKQPDFADAEAQLGWLLLRKVLTVDGDDVGDDDWLRANAVIDGALHSAPQNSLAIASKARELFIEGKYRDAVAAANNALNIEPSSMEARWVLVDCAWMSGQPDAELPLLRAIHRLNPESAQDKRVQFLEGVVSLLQFHPADAIGFLLQSISGEPEPTIGTSSNGRTERARLWLVAAYALNRELDKARDKYREYDAVWPNRSVWRFGAYLPRRIMALPATMQVLQALQQAGMPKVADPGKTVLAPGRPCGEDAFAPTPLALPQGGRTIDAREVHSLMMQSTQPVVIDLGVGSASVHGSRWFDPGGPKETSLQFVDRTMASVGDSNLDTPIIVMADGPYGCSAYSAAVHLISKGYRNVAWFRGGEEAWANSGYVADDRRPR